MLIKEETRCIFDREVIKPGYFIRAKHRSWKGPRNGLVSCVFPDKLAIIGTLAMGPVSDYFTIITDEVATGDWEITWSPDLSLINREGDTQ